MRRKGPKVHKREQRSIPLERLAVAVLSVDRSD